MRSVEESIKELKDQIAKLDNLILMGAYYAHMVNAAYGKCTFGELPSDIQDDYLSIMKDIAESQALKRDLEIMLHAAESIYNRAAVHEDDKNDEEGDEDE